MSCMYYSSIALSSWQKVMSASYLSHFGMLLFISVSLSESVCRTTFRPAQGNEYIPRLSRVFRRSRLYL